MDTLTAAAAAKSLQSCPTLSDPMDCNPPGPAVPGILQARTLEWGAISFSRTHLLEVNKYMTFFLGKFLNFSKSQFLQRQEENEENDPESNASHLNDDSYFYTSIDACRNLILFVYLSFHFYSVRVLRIKSTSVPIYALHCFAISFHIGDIQKVTNSLHCISRR